MFSRWLPHNEPPTRGPTCELRGGGRFPVRPSDVIDELGCVDDDLDDVVREAATRARRALDGVRDKPYYGRVVTVGDLVAFIARQPRVPPPNVGWS